MVKKFISGTLGALMILGSVPCVSNAQTDDEVIFEENFDALDDGILTSIGGAEIAKPNENVTVAQDDVSGSKAAKFTVDEARALLSVPLNSSDWTGKYIYSFEARVENNSKSIKSLGVPQIKKNDGSYANINFTSSNKDNLGYYYFDLSKYDKFVRGSDPIADIMSNRYAKFTYIFDADTRTFDMYRDNVTVAKGTKYYYDGGKEVVSLLFDFGNDSTYNGSSEGTGIYWIDNISVKKYHEEKDDVGENNMFFEGFTNYFEGTQFSQKENNEATIETDPVTGSKALKVKVGESLTTAYGISIPFGNLDTVTGGTYKVSYKMRAEKHTRSMERAPYIHHYYNGTDTNCLGGTVKGDYIFYPYQGYGESFGRMEDYKDKYVAVDYVITLGEGTYTIYVDGERVETGARAWTIPQNLYRMYFEFDSDKQMTTVKPSQSGEGIYWIDDISVDKMTFEADAPTVEKKTAAIALNMAPIQEKPEEYVKLTKNGEEVAADISYADKQIKISNLEPGEYNVSIDGLTAVTGMALNGYSADFTVENKTFITGVKLTDSEGNEVSGINANLGGSVSAEMTVEPANGIENWRTFVILRDSGGRLVEVKSSANEKQVRAELAVPQEADETWQIDFYVWDGMNPLAALKNYNG